MSIKMAKHPLKIDVFPTADHQRPMSEQVFREFVASLPVIAYLKNDRLEHVFINACGLKALGLTLAEFKGTTSRDLLPPEFARLAEAADAKILAGAARVDLSEQCMELHGETRWMHDTKFPVVSASGKRMVAGLSLDITDRVRVELMAHEHHEFEQVIAGLAARLTQTHANDLRETLDWLLRSLGEFLGTERAFLFLLPCASYPLDGMMFWTADGIDPGPIFLDLNPEGRDRWLFQRLDNNLAIVAGPGMTGLPKEGAATRAQLLELGVSSGVLVPCKVGGNCAGMLGVDTLVRPREYSEAVVDRMRIVADMIGSTLERVVAETDLRNSLDQIGLLKERLEKENLYLRKKINTEYRSNGIVGDSPALKRVLMQVNQVAGTQASVLITGETGTGKEIIALAIHNTSDRCDQPMIRVNCAALPPTLIEGELFGREKGAYTGATTRQAGLFELANGSTIFLDEIGDLPMELQPKLLHVLQDGEFTRLGSNRVVKVDVRVLAATNCDLTAAVADRRFREDLFYRLNVFPIEVPPLRERREDIIPLTWAFIHELSRTMGKRIGHIQKATANALVKYDWPGNVRELKNVVERAMILATGEEFIVEFLSSRGGHANTEQTLDAVQRRHIIEVLKRVNWSVGGEGGAAEALGLPRSTLRARMRKLGITRGKDSP